MKKNLLLFVFALFFSSSSFAQTYGNWSNVLYTGNSKAGINDPNFNSYSKGIQDYLKTAYKDQYVRLITYVVKKGERYTLTIKFPQDGEGRGMQLTCYNPLQTRAFGVSYGNSNISGKSIAHRVNFTNSLESDYDRVVVIVSTSKPHMPFYLRIEYPAVPDNVVDAKSINPAYPEFGKMYWGTIQKEPVLLK